MDIIIPPLNLINYNLFYRWVNEMTIQKEVWKPVPGKPGFEINQKGQLRGRDHNTTFEPIKLKKDPPYKPFQGDEWPDHDAGEIPENFV